MNLVFVKIPIFLAIVAAIAAPASAQLRFQGGHVGVSGFDLHEFWYEPYDPSYNHSEHYREAEINFDSVYNGSQFGIQVGGYFSDVSWPVPAPYHYQRIGANLHGYFISASGNKYGAVIQYSRFLNPYQTNYAPPLVGVESIFALGPFDIEASLVTLANPGEYPLTIGAVQLHFPVNDNLEMRAGYSHRQRQEWRDPMEFYSVGMTYLLPGGRFSLDVDFISQITNGFSRDALQIGARYRFGQGNTGRLFADRRSGIGRLGI